MSRRVQVLLIIVVVAAVTIASCLPHADPMQVDLVNVLTGPSQAHTPRH